MFDNNFFNIRSCTYVPCSLLTLVLIKKNKNKNQPVKQTKSYLRFIYINSFLLPNRFSMPSFVSLWFYLPVCYISWSLVVKLVPLICCCLSHPNLVASNASVLSVLRMDGLGWVSHSDPSIFAVRWQLRLEFFLNV